MDLPGLITVEPSQTKTIDQLATMMGTSFMEEGWTQVWLSILDEIGTSHERKLEISRAIIKSNFIVGAPYQCVRMLPDMSAATGAYLSSDLNGRIWNDLEDESMEIMIETILDENERTVLLKRAQQMERISNFKWMTDRTQGKDFIHFFAIGVAPEKRGSGAFRKLLTPFLNYADEQGIECYLECFSDKTEGIYSHFGFETIERFDDPAFAVTERCMARKVN